MPQTSSAVALWLVKLDAMIALQLDEKIVETAKGMLVNKFFFPQFFSPFASSSDIVVF